MLVVGMCCPWFQGVGSWWGLSGWEEGGRGDAGDRVVISQAFGRESKRGRDRERERERDRERERALWGPRG